MNIAPKICRPLWLDPDPERVQPLLAGMEHPDDDAHVQMALRLAAQPLPGQLRAAMVEYDHVDPDAVARVCADVSRVFFTQLTQPGANSSLTDESQTLLNHWDYMLSKKAPTPSVSKAALDEYEQEVKDLLDAVRDDSSLAPVLRAFIIEHLGKILEAIIKARVLGPEVFADVVDAAAGALPRLVAGIDDIEQAGKHPLLRRWVEVVSHVADLSQIYSTVAPALGFAATFAVAISGAPCVPSTPTTPPAIHAPAVPGQPTASHGVDAPQHG